MPEFQDVDVPQGQFIGFGKVGQEITVKVVSFDPIGARDFNDQPCPRLVGTLTEDADNYRDKGASHERLDAGDMVTVSAGIANLKAGLLAADPKPGDLVRMVFTETYKAPKGEGKAIKVQIARHEQSVSADSLLS